LFRKRGQQGERRCEVTEAEDSDELPLFAKAAALHHCLETLYEFLEEKDEHQHLTHVVVEQRGKKEDDELELEFRRICDGLNTREKILPFEILFSDKKAMSSGLQLAEVARPIGLH
jgi:alpha-glucosidase (family GH31 glycosyl hydrolase)